MPVDPLQRGLVKLRHATELALGYPDQTITRAEAHALLEEFERLYDRDFRLRGLEK